MDVWCDVTGCSALGKDADLLNVRKIGVFICTRRVEEGLVVG
jgi:hypothetical protein